MTPVDAAAEADEPVARANDIWRPRIVALVCNWCSYAGADMAGTTRMQYPADVRLVRFPCTGRMSPLMIIRAFDLGADGVLVSGCHPGDCHYVHGNLVARRRFTVFRSLIDFLGIDLRRLHFAWVSAAEGRKWARVVEEVTAAVREAGPMPPKGGLDQGGEVALPQLAGGAPPELSPEQVETLRHHLSSTAVELLASERVGMVLGYRRGSLPGRVVPAMVSDPDDAALLVWGHGCVSNLASYLPASLDSHERVAVVAKSCDLGAVAALLREHQVARDRVVVIGVQCPGVHPGAGVADKCLSCAGSPGTICDLSVAVDGVYEASPDQPEAPLARSDPRDDQIAHLESLAAAQRWRYWSRQFARCLRCYACRAACPLCYCSSCVTEKHRPQWISPVIDVGGNRDWNVVRAIHLAGRCSGCDECARACPADIRLDLINRKLAVEIAQQFGGPGLDPESRSALTDFRMDDPEEFIL
jgi:coenzyme F420-reducing hydrogenase delta subunit/ferredoxin